MKFRLLPTTFDENGRATQQQHLACFVVDDCVAVDAGSLAMSVSERQRENIRDVVLTHAHLDHIAGLPLFIDDLFTTITEPLRIYSTKEVQEILERDIFNWEVFPRFSELKNSHGEVLRYVNFKPNTEFSIKHFTFKAVEVNHKVPAVGFVIADAHSRIVLMGDTSRNENFWNVVNAEKKIDALLIECAFPDFLAELAATSFHMTPKILRSEVEKFQHRDARIFVVNLKPTFRAKIIAELAAMKIPNLEILEVGRIYEV
jgi:ribonuclease BN (tRNA processing enzyme)